MLYAITDRHLYAKDEDEARRLLLDHTAAWAANGVAFIQLREKDLPARDQVELARALVDLLKAARNRTGRTTRLLINGRPDVAIAAGADGVHLPSTEALAPKEVRRIFAAAGSSGKPAISISCHSIAEVEAARRDSPDCILFAPVFEKMIQPAEASAGVSGAAGVIAYLSGAGLPALQRACDAAHPVPVFALGGVTVENASLCLEAGAAGIAAIRWMREPAGAWRRFARQDRRG